MRVVAVLVLTLVAVLVVAMGWQHLRYLQWRRAAVQDHQPLLHSSSAFHVISYLRLGYGDDLVESLAKTRETLEGTGGSQWIYAGKVVLMGLRSSQPGEPQWEAIVMSQCDSRGAYDEVVRSSAHRQAFAHFDATYRHGMQRAAGLNLLIPMFLLGARVADILSGVPVIDPHDRASDEDLAGRGLTLHQNSPAIEAARAYNKHQIEDNGGVLPGHRLPALADPERVLQRHRWRQATRRHPGHSDRADPRPLVTEPAHHANAAWHARSGGSSC